KITIPDEFQHEKELNLEVYDQTGRLIQQARMKIAGNSVELDIRAQAKGLYHAILSNGKKSYSGKIIFD
ncbi:MAG: T9SS type A sorting domain-containing protein, partial [Bacteroidota bacterium]